MGKKCIVNSGGASNRVDKPTANGGWLLPPSSWAGQDAWCTAHGPNMTWRVQKLTAVVQTERLSKHYGAVTALAGVGFECGAGDVVGVLGLNGAGKSTLLRILAGELLPSSGSVQVGGVEPGVDSRAMRSRVGYLPEEPPLYREMRVRDYLGFVGALNGVSRNELPGRIATVAASRL